MKTKLILLSLLLISCGTEKETKKYPIIIGYSDNYNNEYYYCDSVQKNNYGIVVFKDGLKIELDRIDYESISFTNE